MMPQWASQITGCKALYRRKFTDQYARKGKSNTYGSALSAGSFFPTLPNQHGDVYLFPVILYP